ncbi:MAG: S8 family serine peptidase [Chitinophagales bacterium]
MKKTTCNFSLQQYDNIRPTKGYHFYWLTALLLFCSMGSAYAQTSYNKYWVGFADKANTAYLLSHPENFLSERAIDRRLRYRIPLTKADLPVSPNHLQSVRQSGATVLYPSKWFNGAVVSIENPNVLEELKKLPFVTEVTAIGKDKKKRRNVTITSKFSDVQLKVEDEDEPEESIYYGAAFHQIEMLKGDYLHAHGFTGEGMLIAVIDAGFSNVEKMEVFQHLYENHKIVGTYDFVDIDQNPYHDSTHGTHVLSTIAAKLPGQFVGTAPDASFWLFRTEDNKSESRIEEYNWVAAAEMADSAGVDVINTSLGYTTFDDSSMDYSAEDLNGNTAVITRGADIAASKGMLVVVSAGNKGNKQWQYLTTPADADSVLTVGAVNKDEKYASFSSIGLEIDSNNKVKPNLMAQGQSAETVTVDGTIQNANGTSFSSPIMAGLVTCLLQAHPRQNPQAIIAALEKSASQYEIPSQEMGYGIPDFQSAHLRLSELAPSNMPAPATAFVYPNPFDDTARVYYYAPRSESITLQLFDLTGRLYEEYHTDVLSEQPYKFDFSAWQSAPKGIYVVRIANAFERIALQAVKTSD